MGRRETRERSRLLTLFSGKATSLPVYLLRDEFTTDAAAPLTSPRTCEPGPGTLTITDTGNLFSITGGVLAATGISVGASDPLVLTPSTYTRASGLALLASASIPVGTTASGRIGWFQSGTTGYGVIYGDGVVSVDNAGALSVSNQYVANALENVAIIQRSAGYFHIHKDKLLFVTASDTGNRTAGLWGNAAASRRVPSFGFIRIAQLGAPWTDYGIATTNLTGARSAGDTYSHETNGWLYLDNVTRPSAGSVIASFRKQDASNYWAVEITSAGDLNLLEYVSGTPTTRATAAGVVSTSHRVGVQFDGANIRGFSGTVAGPAPRWTYSSATNFQTATAGALESFGTGGGVTGLNTWPWTLSGAALTELSKWLA